MLEPVVVFLRLAQYAGAAVLFGAALLNLRAPPMYEQTTPTCSPGSRRLLMASATLILVASVLGLLAQTSVLAGSLSEGLQIGSLSAAVTTMAFGPSSLVRAAAAAGALFVGAALPMGRRLHATCTLLGAVILGSFAWMGHGAATRGPSGALHLVADLAHLLAAGAWIGALVAFVCLLRPQPDHRQTDRVLYAALSGFSGQGSALVAIIIATGIVNTWFLVGPSRLQGLWTTTYGQLLCVKLILFMGMLALAARNRFALTPAFGEALSFDRSCTASRAALRHSVLKETGLALLILALVAWLGRLAPTSALQ